MKQVIISVQMMMILFFSLSAKSTWFPYSVEIWDPPFNTDNIKKKIEYVPLKKASKPVEICVSFPHMKDAYWLGVNYGVVDEAKRLGVRIQLVEAGGYTELNNQISQIEDCVLAGAKAVIIGAISFVGLNNLIAEIDAKGIPVIDLVNGVSSPKISAKSLVSFHDMGKKAGKFLADKHQRGKKKKVAWLPGPAGAGWVEAGNKGFIKAIKESNLDLVEIKYGDTGKEVQIKLIEDILETHPDLTYIVGTAVTAEAAIPILRARGLMGRVQVVSYYYTPGVDQGIRRGQIMAAPSDSPVIQGRIAVDQAVRILEKRGYHRHVGPEIFMVTKVNYKKFNASSTLAPKRFKPLFRVK